MATLHPSSGKQIYDDLLDASLMLKLVNSLCIYSTISLNVTMQVIVLSFGEAFPENSDRVGVQIFSVCVAVVGLAAFALVLALVEQVSPGISSSRAGEPWY